MSLENLPEPIPVQLQKLSQRHKQVLSLVAQGVERQTVAEATGYTPEYVTWLVRQDVCRDYLREMMELVDIRFVMMTQESANAISDALAEGTYEDRLKAAKLQLEVVGKVGKGASLVHTDQPQGDRLEQLANRLVGLLRQKREGVVLDGISQDVTEG